MGCFLCLLSLFLDWTRINVRQQMRSTSPGGHQEARGASLDAAAAEDD